MCVSSARILKDPWPWLCKLGVHVAPVCLSTYLWALVLHALRDEKRVKKQRPPGRRKRGWGGVVVVGHGGGGEGIKICKSRCSDACFISQAEQTGGRPRNTTSSSECPGDMLVYTITGLQVIDTR